MLNLDGGGARVRHWLCKRRSATVLSCFDLTLWKFPDVDLELTLQGIWWLVT